MKFTVNIPVTRKRTKHGYYLLYTNSHGLPIRRLYTHKAEAIRILKGLMPYAFKGISIITARDYAKKTKSKPPA